MSYHKRRLKKIHSSSYLLILLFIFYYNSCLCATLYNETVTKLDLNENISFSLDIVANKLRKEITTTTNDELGITFIKKMYNKFKYTSILQDVEKNLKRITDKLELKINESFTLLNKTCYVIEELYYKSDGEKKLHSFILPCNNEDSNCQGFNIFGNCVNPNKNVKSAIKQYYFLSNHDVATEVDAGILRCKKQDHSLLWDVYIRRVNTLPRNIMLLLDHGGSLSKQQFKIVKETAKSIISYLREEDNIGLLALADDVSSPYKTDQCLMPNQAPPVGEPYIISSATKHNKNLLIHFTNSLSKGSGTTNHSLGFQQALQTIKSSNIPNNETVMLIYISRGLLSILTEAKIVLKTISDNLSTISNSIIINTCAVIDETKSVLYEMHFLGDIVKNYSKYNSGSGTGKHSSKGIMLPVNSTQNVGLAVARFFNTLNPNSIKYELTPMLSLPRWDDVSKDITIAATVGCGNNSEIGVIGLDIHFPSFVEDITYYSNYQHYTYAFIIDTKGTTIMHPSYPRPTVITEQPLFVDIQYLEKVPNIKTLREFLLTKDKGNFTISVSTEEVRYFWRRVSNWYVVCIVFRYSNDIPQRPYKVTWHPSIPGIDLVHYRLDLFSSTPLCKHLNQLATLDAGTLYLSSSCFQSTYTYAQTTTLSSLTIQSYMAYLKDNTRLLANPGLREEVRDDVAAMAHVLEYLRDQHLQGAKSKYIVRRYIVSRSGVLQIFPGALISPGLEPTRRNWYLKSIEHKYKTILTPPYLDAGGAGYIVTLAYATSHIVSAMDVTFGYIYKLILEHMPSCKEPNIKCFMMDDRGYLIYHPNLIDPNGHGPIEQQHIIHKESLVANDILSHKQFVKKMLCNDYLDGTTQRYYRLNTSLDNVLGNAVPGEHCVKYQVSAIRETNVFIGIVNASCEVVATFCPCSVVDRLCLNCNRMEQRECECPCECPLNLDTCTHPNNSYSDNSLCSTTPEQPLSVQSTITNIISELEPCLPINCESQMTHEDCLGVIGCEWCRVDVDGDSLLASPFCTSIQTCFNGILGSPTPYSDQIGSSSNSEDLIGTTYSPIGPVIGSVFGVCLGLVFLFFCYRSYTSPSVERFYLTSTQENRIRMSDVNVSDDYRDVDNHQDKLLQDSKKLEPVSPYCVSTGYCRPPTVADSDHGYSTMTPHDESEHLSFAPLELDSLEDDVSDATSINTSVSSRQPQAKMKLSKLQDLLPDTHLTNPLPFRNCIIAPVTVHRNMETT